MSKADIIHILQAEFPTTFFRQTSEQPLEGGTVVSDDITEMPPALAALAARGKVLVHAIDGLVPLRAIDPRKPRQDEETGAPYMMQGHHLVRAFKQRIERAQRRYGGTQETVLSFDKSVYVPITKGPEQEKRRQAGAKAVSETAREAAMTPLLEIPAEEAYVTTETQLGDLGVWSEIMEDRLPADCDEERQAYKVLEDGQRFARHQGRRQSVIALVCFALLTPQGDASFCGGGQSHELTLTLGVNERVYLDGHCLRPEFFLQDMENEALGWLAGFFPPAPALLKDDTIDWNTIPLVAWRQPGHGTDLMFRFAVERRNTIGEGDFTMFAYAARAPGGAAIDGEAVIVDTIDTDGTLLAMLFQQRHPELHCFVRITQRLTHAQQLTAALRNEPLSELRAWPKYVDARALLSALERKFEHAFANPLASFLAAMLTRGSDYTPTFAHVTHQRFWEALCQQADFVGGALATANASALAAAVGSCETTTTPNASVLATAAIQLDAVCWLRLVLAAYSYAHPARLMREDKLLCTNITDARRVLNGELVLATVVDDDDSEAMGGKAAAKKPKKPKKVAPLAPEKLIPDETTLLSRYCCLNYAMIMYGQVGATQTLTLPSSEDELRLYGFVRRDPAKPLSRLNIKFAH